MEKLQNAILITGAGQRVGYHLAKQFLQQAEYPVIFTYRTPRPQVEELISLGALALQTDFTHSDSLPSLVETVQSQVSSLRCIIHNASLWLPDDQLESTADFQSLFQLHVQVPFTLNAQLTPLLKQSSSPLKDIISLSDCSVNRVSAEHIVYLSSKAAMQTMMKGFAKKLAPEIKVNDIAPALIMFNEGDSEEYKQKRLAQSALGIEPGPQVVWQAVQYLMNSAYTTGTILPLEGGRSL
ncbi:MAG: dihydromonapterin reductase/dihydrofolate reductase [Thiomicrorhabdus sp.]|nr:MAG: dihydromonapterin reductase/dihydrofolate reductase [Thiomicrorhabdus sp.]